MFTRLRSHLPAWRRALRRRRRVLAALVLAAIAATLLPTLLPPSVHGVEALVVTEDLPAGTELLPEHLRTVRVAEELVPAEAPNAPEEVLGSATAHPLPAGTPLLPTMLAGHEETMLPKGTALMAVPVSEVLLPHLAPGSRVELFPMDPTAGARAGITAQVVEGVPHESSAVALGGSPGASPEILVAVPRAHAGELAHALSASAVAVSVIG